MKKERTPKKSGFSMVEVLVATSITGLVLTAVLETFLWCGKQSSLCTKMAWSQQEAMDTSMKLMTYIRNASEVIDIDETTGQSVTLGFPDGETCQLVYSNAVPLLRDGRLYLFRQNRTEMLVARGMTEIMEDDGFTTPVFVGKVGGDSLRIAYRVSEPTSAGVKSANDSAFAVSVRFSVGLRNSDG